MSLTGDSAMNTDRTLWEREFNEKTLASAARVFITKEGALGICLNHYCMVRTIESWHALDKIRDRLDEQTDSLTAKLHAAEEREAKWQPIETAPQTGKVFLICDVRGNRGLGFWGDGGLNTTGPWRVVERVSYWMPIPEPPALSNLAGEG